MEKVTIAAEMSDKIEEISRKLVKCLQEDPNNLSFWYPKVKDCGFRTPRTTVIQLPEKAILALFQDEENDREVIREFVISSVMPVIEAFDGKPFIKNGTFSDKYDFGLCCPDKTDADSLTENIMRMGMDALCLDANGISEIVVRERIPAPEGSRTIYGGMPLRPEFRVFYDFSRGQLLYMENYWNWDYCHEAVARNEHDRKVFFDHYGVIWRSYKESAMRLYMTAEDRLRNITGLEGIWSVDFLLDGNGEFWLIDMAQGHRSVYWDPYKVLMISNYGEINSFYQETGYRQNQENQRFARLKDYVLSIDNSYGDDLIEEFLDAYSKVSTLGMKRYPLSVLEGQYSAPLAFVLKHHREEDRCTIYSLVEYRYKGYSKEIPEGPTKDYCKRTYSENLKVLFAVGVIEFLKGYPKS